MFPKAPCKDCPDRYVGCHGKCQKYIDYKNESQRISDEEHLQREIENINHTSRTKSKTYNWNKFRKNNK